MKPQIIYADPPWEYSDKKANNPNLGGMTYPHMADSALLNLPVSQYAHKNCLLFLWATYPKLPEALAVMAAWGFKYTTVAFTWVKLNRNGKVIRTSGERGRPDDIMLEGGIYSGMGHWVNGNAEICLLGKRGKPVRFAKNVKQIMLAPVGKHSAKPPETRERIVQLAGDLPRVELFARDAAPGWVQTGYDFDGVDIRDFLARGIDGN